MKRFLSIFMIAVMLLSLLPTVFAEDTIVEYAVEGGNIRFDLSTGTVIGADKSVTAAHIPETIEGVIVTAIGRDAFAHYGGDVRLLEEITLPDTVSVLGDYAFFGCTKLKAIDLPDGIETIDVSTFTNCVSLKSVDFPKGLKTIESMAFDNCTALEKIELPEGLERIDTSAFERCTSLAELNVPSTVKSCSSFIGTAFYNDADNWDGDCLYLDNWLLAVKDCEQLIISEGVVGIASNAIYNCPSLKNVTFPEDLRYIGNWNFQNCSKIDEVVFPASLESLGNYAFYCCGYYLDVYFRGPAPEIGHRAFYWIDPMGYEVKETLSDGLMLYFIEGQQGWTMPKYNGYPTMTWTPGHTHAYEPIVTGATCVEAGYTIYACDCGDCYYGEIVKKLSHDYVDGICTYCGISEVDSQYAPDDIVDGGQTGECMMWKLDASGNLTIFGEGDMWSDDYSDSAAWYPYREQIKTATITEGVNTIADYAFNDCENLQWVTLPQSITEIGKSAFSGCRSLQSIEIPWAVTRIEHGTFTNCKSLTNVVLSRELVTIWESAFSNCTSLQTLTIGEKLEGFGWGSFSNCTSLESIYFLGDAPYGEYIQYDHTFHMYDENGNWVQLPNLTFYYLEDAEGWMSPEWYGIPTATWTPEPHEHSFTTTITEPTCALPGYTEDHCQCGERNVYDYTAPLGHDLIEFEGKEPTCSTEGYIGFECVTCGNKNISFQNTLPHDFVLSEVVPPTCEYEGYTIYACLNCEESYTDNYVPVIEHTYEETLRIDSTCTATGLVEYSCTTCDDFYFETLELGEHTFIDGVCAYCGIEEPSAPSEEATEPSEEPTEPSEEPTEPSEEPTEPSEEPSEPSEEPTEPSEEPTEPSEEPSEPNEEPDEPAIPTENPFTDVKESDYFATPVLWAVGKNITNGMSATSFAPNDNCTRGQIVTFLWRACGSPEPTEADNPFTDVKADAYYYKAVLWAVEQGITTGLSATTFGPDATCTRGQVATFLWRSQGEPAPASTNNPFSDVKTSDYYFSAVLWAVENEVTQGMGDGKFAPNASCTRGQIVTFLYRAIA